MPSREDEALNAAIGLFIWTISVFCLGGLMVWACVGER